MRHLCQLSAPCIGGATPCRIAAVVGSRGVREVQIAALMCTSPTPGLVDRGDSAAGRMVTPRQIADMPSAAAGCMKLLCELQRRQVLVVVGSSERFRFVPSTSTPFPTNYGQSTSNSVKAQPLSTVRLPNHARTAAKMPNRRNCRIGNGKIRILPALFPK